MINVNKKYYLVDGYNDKTKTIYEFYGDYWHGNPNRYKREDINVINKKNIFRPFYEIFAVFDSAT